MANFIYLGLRVNFEGYDEEMSESQKSIIKALVGSEDGSGATHIEMKQLSLIVSRRGLKDDSQIGKKINIEAKKLIKSNKEK